MKTLLMFSLILFSACFTNLFSQNDYQNSGIGSSAFLVKGNSINFEFHQITGRKNGYTLQSNGSPQQLWVDLNNPEFLHAVFTNSQWKDPPFPDRTCLYFASTSGGNDWFELGPVPDSSRSGFPSIYGTSDGAAVITNHSSYFDQTTRTGLFVDTSPFHYQFTPYDPGAPPGVTTIWPRCIVAQNGNIVFASSGNGPDSNYVNTLDPTTGIFSGWIGFDGEQAEQYFLAISDNGKIGMAYNGQAPFNDGDVYYSESLDDGLSWSVPIKIFDRPDNQNISMGALRGVSLNFYGEEPCVVFEIVKQDFNAGVYYSRLPNEIHFWSPNINGGVSKSIADSNNVPFAPNLTSTEVFAPICRPVIGRSQNDNYLFVAFSAATSDVFVGTDSMTYFAGYFTMSSNGGETWWHPNKFTPDIPLLDWKYISIAHINPTIFNTTYINMILQGDSLESSPNPLFLSAKYFHTSTVFPIVHVEEGPFAIIDFKLGQNYPNPFNPTTAIAYQIPERSFITLKVYDVLGNEIATIINEEKPAGNYEVEFNSHSGEARNLPSGIYFYQLKAGNFVETKKMVLIK